jgi:hypothetical protein
MILNSSLNGQSSLKYLQTLLQSGLIEVCEASMNYLIIG